MQKYAKLSHFAFIYAFSCQGAITRWHLCEVIVTLSQKDKYYNIFHLWLIICGSWSFEFISTLELNGGRNDIIQLVFPEPKIPNFNLRRIVKNIQVES